MTRSTISHFLRFHNDSIAKILAALLAISFIILYVVLSWQQVTYPFEIEWMEGSLIRHAARIFHGQQLYVSPTIEFTNWLYQPLSYYFVALVMPLTGITCTAGRIVSFSFTIATALLIYYSVLRLTDRSHFFAFIGSGLFLSCYGLVGFYFTIVRPDPIYLFLAVASIIIVLFSERPWAIMISALLTALSILTKQQAIYYALPIIIWLFLRKRSDALLYVSFLLLCFAIGTIIFYILNGDWYFYYVYSIPGAKSGGFRISRLIFAFSWFIFSGWGIAVFGIAMSYVLIKANRTDFIRSPHGLLLLFILTAAGHIMMHLGDLLSARNSALPFAAAISVAAPIAFYEAKKWLPASYRSFAIWAIVGQFLAVVYNPNLIGFGVITSADRSAATTFVDSLKAIQGDVLLWNNSIATEFSGKRPHANDLAMADVICVGDSTAKRLRAERDSAYTKHLYSAIIIDDGALKITDSIPGYRYSRTINSQEPMYRTYANSVVSYPRYVLVPK